jgi:MarR family transcriptional regulator, organic hydroperoxide resistance regulator
LLFSKALIANRSAGDKGNVLKRVELDLSEYLPYLINRVGAALVERFTQDALDATHLTIGMWRLLLVLSNQGGTRQVDLAGLTSIEVSNVSRLVTRLIQMDLVSRARSATSNREVVVELTSKGKSLVAGLVPVAIRLEQIAMRGVSKKELAAAKHVLRQMHQNLAQHAVPTRSR